MKKSNNICIDWGNRLNGILKHPLGEKSKSTIKQKDLARALGVRESNITEWKRGSWDLRLSSIYGIVEYIKKEYPESTPMQTLFPDLVNDEIDRSRQTIIDEYKKKCNELEEKKKQIERLRVKQDNLENAYNTLKESCKRFLRYLKNNSDITEKSFKNYFPPNFYE